MKFGKQLQSQIEETLLEWQDKFLSYKDLKKLVKFISTAREASPSSLGSDEIRSGSNEVPNKRWKISGGPFEAGDASNDNLSGYL